MMEGGGEIPGNVDISATRTSETKKEDEQVSVSPRLHHCEHSDSTLSGEARRSSSSLDYDWNEDDSQKSMTSFQIWCNPSHPLIAKDLEGMTRERRELVWADLSGNRKGSLYYQELEEKMKETPDNVRRVMEELEHEIHHLPTFALLRKVQKSHPEFVNNTAFRMQFLRCERFDVKETLKRMMRYFEEKKLLWGEECLGREITILDLDDEDVECLRAGAHSILTNLLDSNGRRIYLTNRDALKCYEPKCILRANWYMVMKTIREDENVQKLGVIRIGYFLNYKPKQGGGQLDPGVFPKLSQYGNILPIRFSAIYFVSDCEAGSWDVAINNLLNLASTAFRVRSRLIKGSYQECRYLLACLGITSFPVREDGTMDMSEHWKWVDSCNDTEGPRKRQKKETQSSIAVSDD